MITNISHSAYSLGKGKYGNEVRVSFDNPEESLEFYNWIKQQKQKKEEKQNG